jgi:hypothetical protein
VWADEQPKRRPAPQPERRRRGARSAEDRGAVPPTRVGPRLPLDPFHGYKNAIGDQLQDAIAVVDGFRLVQLAGPAVEEVRRRVQQQTLGHRGRSGDPL